MKEFGANLPVKERWVSVGTKVDEKTPKQCFERYKVLCAKHKAAVAAKSK
jgi:hypothetical protein